MNIQRLVLFWKFGFIKGCLLDWLSFCIRKDSQSFLFGMCLPFMLKQHEPLLSHQPKLEPVPKLIKDTIYLTKTDTQKIIQCDTVFRTRWIEQPLKDEAHEQDGFHEQECTSVQCDGINYALLVSN